MKRLVVTALILLSPCLAQAQPADDPGLSETPPAPKPAPPPPTATPPVPHSDASATVMAPHDESLTASEPRETVDTQVTWLDSAGPNTADDDLYARLAAPTVTGPIGLFRTMTGDVGRANNFRVGLAMQLFTQDNFLIAGSNGVKGDTNSALPRQPHHRLHAVEVSRALPRALQLVEPEHAGRDAGDGA